MNLDGHLRTLEPHVSSASHMSSVPATCHLLYRVENLSQTVNTMDPMMHDVQASILTSHSSPNLSSTLSFPSSHSLSSLHHHLPLGEDSPPVRSLAAPQPLQPACGGLHSVRRSPLKGKGGPEKLLPDSHRAAGQHKLVHPCIYLCL